jgi:hypothetical protein
MGGQIAWNRQTLLAMPRLRQEDDRLPEALFQAQKDAKRAKVASSDKVGNSGPFVAPRITPASLCAKSWLPPQISSTPLCLEGTCLEMPLRVEQAGRRRFRARESQ